MAPKGPHGPSLLKQPAPGSDRASHAQALFTEAAQGYDRISELLSYGQYVRWQQTLVDAARAHGVGPGASVLDVACGTGKISLHLARELDCEVWGVDLTRSMLHGAAAKLERGDDGSARHRGLVQATADRLPMADGRFDAVTFSYLYRYVDDPVQTTRELLRPLRPGGFIGFVEFHVPQHGFLRNLWRLHTRIALPLGGRVHGPGWARVGAFLGPNIEAFYTEWNTDGLAQMWREAGIEHIQTRTLSLGGGLVMWGQKA